VSCGKRTDIGCSDILAGTCPVEARSSRCPRAWVPSGLEPYERLPCGEDGAGPENGSGMWRTLERALGDNHHLNRV
jgi:hypothetical protein